MQGSAERMAASGQGLARGHGGGTVYTELLSVAPVRAPEQGGTRSVQISLGGIYGAPSSAPLDESSAYAAPQTSQVIKFFRCSKSDLH